MNDKSGENIWNLKLSCRSQFFLVLLNIFRCLVFSSNCKDYVYFHLLRAMLVTSSALCLNVGWNALFWFHSILKNLVIIMMMMMILSRQFRNWSLPYIFKPINPPYEADATSLTPKIFFSTFLQVVGTRQCLTCVFSSFFFGFHFIATRKC